MFLAQTVVVNQAPQSATGLVIIVAIELALLIVMIAGLWKMFVKAGKPGWAAIVPIYNLIVLLEISEKPIWWIVLFIIPIVSLVFTVLLNIALAAKFGKGGGFVVGMIFLPFIFFPILGFGDAQYVGRQLPNQGFEPIMPAR